ncbi:MAG: cysteine synthase A [Coriobacteriales bacterium]|nr:cysteine synthase A [Coriobacteriales bacterium]
MSAFAIHTNIAPRVDETMFNTPAVRLNRLGAGLGAQVVVKLESRNPGGSVKDRIGRSMLDDAEQRGIIEPGRSVIVEPTSGNTGIALAMLGASRGYRVILTMPESMSLERRKLLRGFGAELVLTPKEKGMKGAVETANDVVASTENAWTPAQFDNPANVRVHYDTTGPEIASVLGGARLGAFIAGVGTGGTVSGAGRYLKERFPESKVVAVEPAESPIIAQTRAGEDITPAPHMIQGIGANFIPTILDLDALDAVEHVSSDDAIATARRLASEEGLFVGISSGANVAAALRLAALPEYEGSTIVTLAPSTGERYLTTKLWEDVG